MTHGSAEQVASQDHKAKEELKGRNAAGKQAKSARLAGYQRPHRVHTEQEEHIAHLRKRQLELLESAEQYAVDEDEVMRLQRNDEIEDEENKLKGFNLDERRKKRGQRDAEGDEEKKDDDQGEEAAKSLGFTEGTGKFFQDAPADRMGDLTLTSPEDIKKILGPSVRFAQHAMLLAENELKGGMKREDALAYMASLFVGLTDSAYANKALRDFGPGTGIVDLYPLEVMQHLLQHVPGFVTKISTAKFFVNVPKEGYDGFAGEPILLRYPEGYRIRGFAIKGGDKPGYLFEPTDPPGTYLLTIASPGTYTVIVSALAKGGVLSIEEFPARIKPGRGNKLEASDVMKRARANLVEEEEGAAPQDEEPKAKKKDQDLKVVIPRRI